MRNVDHITQQMPMVYKHMVASSIFTIRIGRGNHLLFFCMDSSVQCDVEETGAWIFNS